MRIWGHRYSRDLQRYNLALRMIAHEARTHTICEWAGLPEDRVRNLYQSYYHEHGKSEAGRRRGPSPQSLSFFFGTARSRSESAALVGLCYLLDVLPTEVVKNPRRELPGVPRGHRLCVAYEMYLELVPHTTMTLEHLVLLIMTVAHGHEFQAGHCISCGGVIVIDRSSLRRWSCTHCGDQIAREQPMGSEVYSELDTDEALQSDLFVVANQRADRKRSRR
jgi:predicted RNA-binding Zn-ribbon protein involved in translation (DUF1610 family)